ncbi:MAG: hypothetical protein HeimC2_04510 [Candidatus Heimdallarchaeota archaeon LC_2]|nr:MAG: hypothetical protein HeimC2_04510 [Candidatus Heimdallarchaeota archaeon LC_2]
MLQIPLGHFIQKNTSITLRYYSELYAPSFEIGINGEASDNYLSIGFLYYSFLENPNWQPRGQFKRYFEQGFDFSQGKWNTFSINLIDEINRAFNLPDSPWEDFIPSQLISITISADPMWDSNNNVNIYIDNLFIEIDPKGDLADASTTLDLTLPNSLKLASGLFFGFFISVLLITSAHKRIKN